jgi:hypothetical protein
MASGDFGSDDSRRVVDDGVQIFAWHSQIDQTKRDGATRIDEAAGEQQVHACLAPHCPTQGYAGCRAEEAEIDPGDRELRDRGGVGQIAAGHELTPRRDRGALQRAMTGARHAPTAIISAEQRSVSRWSLPNVG